MIRLRPSGADEVLIKRVQNWYEPGPGVFIQSLTASFSPAMLFTGSTTGAWYDPSDTTTLFQDAAGTTPVTAVEQPVGLMLDKSKGLVLGPELVTNGDFATDTGWTKSTASVTISGGSLNFNSSTGYARQASSAWNGSFVELTIVVSSISAGAVYLGWDGGVSTPNITTAGTYTYRRRNESNNFYVIASGTTTATVDLVSMKAIQGNHAFNSSGNSANFPVLQQDGTGRYYLAFNGTNQWLQTNSIDFTYGDKMFVCAGVRKLSDGTFPIIVETYKLSASTFDSFSLHGSQSSTLTGYAAGITTTATSYWSGATGNRAAPITDVVSVTYNSKATTFANAIQLRINTSSQTLTDISSAGIVTTNNFGSNPLSICAREGSSLWFNGRLYQMVVAGKQASASEITNTETFINQKTGAY